ncbi:MAG: hypothetical protein KDB71_06775 [Mycobacterium sp.]|nr:hypothetical protein [Mycobacterium sp.]
MVSLVADLAGRAGQLGATAAQLGGALAGSAIELGGTLGQSMVQLGDAALEPVRPQDGPATQRWGLGVGELAADIPVVPDLLRPIVRRLNRFGSVVISPKGVEYDGDEVDWTAVTEIRTHRLVGYLLTGAIDKQASRLPMGWLPGRALVIDALTNVALTAVAVAADGRLSDGVFAARIPADVYWKKLLRSKRMSPSVPAALILADPAVAECVTSTARAHGVVVHPAADDAVDAAERRAAAIRATFDRAAELVTRFRK